MAAALLVSVLLAALVGCGESIDEQVEREEGMHDAELARKCKHPAAAAVRELERSLPDETSLRKVRAVRSADTPPLAGFERTGTYYISGDVQATGPRAELYSGTDDFVTWAVTGEFLQGGGGLAIAADQMTREVSELGAEADREALGIGPGVDGYDTSQDCVSPP